MAAPPPDPSLLEFVVIGVPGADELPAVAAAMRRLEHASGVRLLDAVSLGPNGEGGWAIAGPLLEGSSSPGTAREAATMLLGRGDLDGPVAAHDPALSALVVAVLEDVWARPLADAARGCGGGILGGERLTGQRVELAVGRLHTVDAEGGADDPMNETVPDAGLVEYVVINLPALPGAVGVVDALRSVVPAQVRILDAVAVEVAPDGRATVFEPEAVGAPPGLADLDGLVGGMLSSDDISLVCDTMTRGTSALILVLEDRWAAPLVDALRGLGGRILGGARLVDAGRVSG